MSQVSRQAMTTTSAAGFPELLSNGTANVLAKLREHRRLAHNRKVIDELSDSQLADAGIDRSKHQAPRPTLEIERGLMANLMSMR